MLWLIICCQVSRSIQRRIYDKSCRLIFMETFEHLLHLTDSHFYSSSFQYLIYLFDVRLCSVQYETFLCMRERLGTLLIVWPLESQIKQSLQSWRDFEGKAGIKANYMISANLQQNTLVKLLFFTELLPLTDFPERREGCKQWGESEETDQTAGGQIRYKRGNEKRRKGRRLERKRPPK